MKVIRYQDTIVTFSPTDISRWNAGEIVEKSFGQLDLGLH